MKCKLRPMTKNDLAMVLAWRNHPDVRKNMYTSHEISLSEHQSWWQRESNNPQTNLLIAEVAESAVGVVIFSHIRQDYRSATWAFYSGDTSARGVGTYMEMAALDYAFNELKLNRLECEVLSFNYEVVLFHRKFGFKLEGIKRQAYVRDGEPHDIYCLALLEHDWLQTLQDKLSLPKRISHSMVLNDEQINASAPDESAQYILEADLTKLVLDTFCASINLSNITLLEQSLKFKKPISLNGVLDFEFRLISSYGDYAEYKIFGKVADNLVIEGELSCKVSDE